VIFDDDWSFFLTFRKDTLPLWMLCFLRSFTLCDYLEIHMETLQKEVLESELMHFIDTEHSLV